MLNDRLNFKVFKWCYRNVVNNKKNWCHRTMSKFKECHFDLYTNIDNILHKN